MYEENVVEHHHALTVTESESADPRVATILEEQFIGNHGKLSHLDMVDEKKRNVVFCNACMETQRWTLSKFSLIVRRLELGNHAPKERCLYHIYIYSFFFFFLYCIDSTSFHLALHFLFNLCCLIDLLNDFN
jgi:hypothetical protein